MLRYVAEYFHVFPSKDRFSVWRLENVQFVFWLGIVGCSILSGGAVTLEEGCEVRREGPKQVMAGKNGVWAAACVYGS